MTDSIQYAAHAKPIVLSPSKPGPKFSREDLEGMASGNISPYFGEWFKPLDEYQKIIRMPEPPLLLADRVTGIVGEPGSLGRGTIWTETDVKADSWYLHQGRMPAGIMLESGQADLLLASWLGHDINNRGTRVYRLLGSEILFFGELPKPGETLVFTIHIDGYAKLGDIQLFFFHYDCHVNGELRLLIRNCQAGFFSEEELANSGGILWDAETAEIDTSKPMGSPLVACQHRHFSKHQIERFSEGHIYECFGLGFESSLAHTCPPRISSGKMLLIDEITHFDLYGGPWQRGYMRAVKNITPDDWFFKGHFKNDPCMPGTLMMEAGSQVMACYITALGFTLDKDDWRFEPVPDQSYKLRCRGQVTPIAQQIVYEIFVTSVVAGPIPMVFAELLGTVDGLKSFHFNIGLRLVPN